MKTYLVLSANKNEFLEACKRFNVKCEKLPHYVKSNPIFSFKKKKEALKECRRQNNFKAKNEIEFLLTWDIIYYFKEITIY